MESFCTLHASLKEKAVRSFDGSRERLHFFCFACVPAALLPAENTGSVCSGIQAGISLCLQKQDVNWYRSRLKKVGAQKEECNES